MSYKLLVALSILAIVGFRNSPRVWGEQVVLFPYFDSNGENGVFLCWSKDGRKFNAVHKGQAIFKPPVWEGQSLTRDPSIVQHDGMFHMVWTSNWNGAIFGYASSPDLKTWSEPKRIQPFPEGTEQPKNVWAPEVFRDNVAGNFKIVWSSTLLTELGDGDSSEDSHGYDHRMFYVETSDFEEFTEPQLLFQDENYSVIDAYVTFDDGSANATGEPRWVMVLKKELPPERDGKNLRIATSPAKIARESFGDTSAPIVGPGTEVSADSFAEGASLLRWNDQWMLYWDSYSRGHYSLATSPDLVNWTDQSEQLEFPRPHPRHGSFFVADTDATGWPLETTDTE